MSFYSRPLVAEPPKAYAIGGSRRVPYWGCIPLPKFDKESDASESLRLCQKYREKLASKEKH